MNDYWLRNFKGSPGLRTLKVEYETLTNKRGQMMHIIHRNRQHKLPVKREGGSADDFEGYLIAEGQPLDEWKWSGPSKLNGIEWRHHGTGDTVEYTVITDTWRFVEGQLKSEEA